MRQRFWLDRPWGAVYLAAMVLGCGRLNLEPLMPVAADTVSREVVQGWVEPTVPEGHLLHRFRWLYRDDRSSAGGRGSARIASPDTLRFDAVGPFGSSPTAAVVIGDSTQWVDPEDAVDKLVPSFPLMWAMFGVARLPADGARLRGLSDGPVTLWEYAVGPDTVEYRRTVGERPTLVAQVRRGGRVVGRAETRFGPDGAPLKARLTVPSGPARLDLTFTSSTRPSAFDGTIWHRSEP